MTIVLPLLIMAGVFGGGYFFGYLHARSKWRAKRPRGKLGIDEALKRG